MTEEIIRRFKSENSYNPSQFDVICHELFSELNPCKESAFLEFSSATIPFIMPVENSSFSIPLTSILQEIQDLSPDTGIEAIIEDAILELEGGDFISFYRWFIHKLGKEKNIGRIFFLCSLNQGNNLVTTPHIYKKLRQFRWSFHPNDILILPPLDLSYYNFTRQFARVIQGHTLPEIILHTYKLFNG